MNSNKRRNNKKNRFTPNKQAYKLTNSGPTGIPDSIRTTLVYTDLIDITVSLPYKNYTFRGNSCYDPDYSGVGHQPLYFDRYMTLYSRYRVVASRIRVNFINNRPTCSIVGVVHANTDPLAIVSYSTIAEQPHTKITDFVPGNLVYPMEIFMQKSTRQVLGLANNELWDEDYSGDVSSNPARM